MKPAEITPFFSEGIDERIRSMQTETIGYDSSCSALYERIIDKAMSYERFGFSPEAITIGDAGYKKIIAYFSKQNGGLTIPKRLIDMKIFVSGHGEGFLLSTGDPKDDLTIAMMDKEGA